MSGRLAFLMVLALAASACPSGSDPCVEVPSARGCVEVIPVQERQPAPVAELPVLEGGDASIADHRGSIVVLNFWASWCGPCRREQPDLNQAHAELAGDDVAFLGIDVMDDEVQARAHRDEFEIPYPSLIDRVNQYTSEFDDVAPAALPATLLLDRQGLVAVRLFGVTEADELSVLVHHLVDEDT